MGLIFMVSKILFPSPPRKWMECVFFFSTDEVTRQYMNKMISYVFKSGQIYRLVHEEGD